MSVLDMTGIHCPECGNGIVNWDIHSLSVDYGDHDAFVRGTCPRCKAGLTASFRICELKLVIDKRSEKKLDLPALGKLDVNDECKQRIKKLFERYHASLIKTRHHADGGQGADWDWDDWEFTVKGVQYTISEWGYSEQFTPDKCTPEFIEFVQPGARKPPEILLQFLKRLGHILFRQRAALDGYGIPFRLPPDAEVKATWDLRR